MTDATPTWTTLHEARDWTRDRVEEGVRCPCCSQFAKVYRRKIHSTIAKSLVRMQQIEKRNGQPWVHVAREISPACELGKARYWSLVEEDPTRSGWWRLTQLGREFVNARTTIPKYARIYDGRCLGLTGPQIRIWDCFPAKFDLAELMAGV